jgi:hypothetical protein
MSPRCGLSSIHFQKIFFLRSIADYGAVLEDLTEEGQRRKPPIYLFPESKLPYPRKTIEDAFLFAFTAMEYLEMDTFVDIPKDILRGAASTLDDAFAPYEHVPAAPRENIRAWVSHRVERAEAQRKTWRYLDKKARIKRMLEFSFTERQRGAWIPEA